MWISYLGQILVDFDIYTEDFVQSDAFRHFYELFTVDFVPQY